MAKRRTRTWIEKEGGPPTKTIAIDPGKKNTWYVCLRNQDLKVHASGTLEIPQTLEGVVSLSFQRAVRRLYKRLRLDKDTEVVIERYVHRAGKVGGTQSEVVNLLIGQLAGIANRMKCRKVILLTSTTHKRSYAEYHKHLYPEAIIDGLRKKHGVWRPRLKRMDPNPHVGDAATLGIYRIRVVEGRI